LGKAVGAGGSVKPQIRQGEASLLRRARQTQAAPAPRRMFFPVRDI
jgi:hypothetical protein